MFLFDGRWCLLDGVSSIKTNSFSSASREPVRYRKVVSVSKQTLSGRTKSGAGLMHGDVLRNNLYITEVFHEPRLELGVVFRSGTTAASPTSAMYLLSVRIELCYFSVGRCAVHFLHCLNNMCK